MIAFFIISLYSITPVFLNILLNLVHIKIYLQNDSKNLRIKIIIPNQF